MQRVMQISMNVTLESRRALVAEMTRRRADLRLTYAEIARRTGVDPSQVNRICKGQFKTLSENVMQICIFLGISEPHRPLLSADLDTHRRQLEAGVLEMWDRTPQDAERILRLLRQLTDLRRTA